MRRVLAVVLVGAALTAGGCTSEPASGPALEPAPASPSSPGPTSRGSGMSELFDAAAGGDVAGVRRALDAGTPVDTRGADGRTPLFVAVTGDHVEVARLLVEAGADPDALDDRHDTPFLETGVSGSVKMLDVVLTADPDVTIVNRFGGVAVIPASERGHVDYVRAVLERTDIDVNHVNNLGWTALLECVVLGDGTTRYQEIARILVAHGADVTIPDKQGVDAVAHARSRDFTEIAEILAAAR